AEAKAGCGDFSGAVRTRFQPLRGGDEILGPLGGVELAKQLTALVVVAWIASEYRQRVRRKCHEILQGEAPCNVLRVRIQSTVLVDDDNAGQFRCRLAA